jgi:hypothetical protein
MQSTSRPSGAIAQLPLLLGFLYCIHRGHEEAAFVLINSPSFDINGQIRLGMTPLMYALRRNHRRIVEEILERPNVKTDMVDIMQRSVLHHAMISRDINMIELILGLRTASLLTRDYAGLTPLHEAARPRLWVKSNLVGESHEILTLLLEWRRHEFLLAYDPDYGTSQLVRHGHNENVIRELREWKAAFDPTKTRLS